MKFLRGPAPNSWGTNVLPRSTTGTPWTKCSRITQRQWAHVQRPLRTFWGLRWLSPRHQRAPTSDTCFYHSPQAWEADSKPYGQGSQAMPTKAQSSNHGRGLSSSSDLQRCPSLCEGPIEEASVYQCGNTWTGVAHLPTICRWSVPYPVCTHKLEARPVKIK